MSPDNSQSQQPVPQAPVQGLPLPQTVALPGGQQPQPAPAPALEAQAAEQVNRLIAQYGSDPYRLNEALSKLRARYIAEQYHVGPGQGEGQ